MEWLINNWYVLVGLIVLVVVVIVMAVKFFNMPTDKQLGALREWLKYAVSMAESELGSGTGQLKLRMVYDMAIEKFSWVAKIYDFEDFSRDVDDALIWLENQLTKNSNIKAIVVGESEDNA